MYGCIPVCGLAYVTPFQIPCKCCVPKGATSKGETGKPMTSSDQYSGSPTMGSKDSHMASARRVTVLLYQASSTSTSGDSASKV